MSFSRSSLRSVSLLSAGSFGQMALHFAYQLVLARIFGASADMDAYTAALALPSVMSVVLVGALQFPLVPVFIRRRAQLGPEAAWETASLVGILLAVAVGLLALLGCLFADPIVRVLQPGFSALQRDLTVRLFRVLAWQTATLSGVSFLQTLYHCERRFLPTVLAPLLGSSCMFVWTLALYKTWGIAAVATGVVAGSLVSVGLLLPLFLSNFRLPRAWDEGTRQVLRMMLPLLLGAAYYKLDPLVDRYLASGLSLGSIAHLGYASRLLGALLLMTTSGLSIVVFPTLAQHSAAGRELEFKAELGHALRFLNFILAPVVTGLVLFSQPLVREMFERGRFTSADTLAVGTLVMLSAGFLIGASIGEILTKVFYSLGDTRTPAWLCAAGFTVGVALKFWLVPQYGVPGLALATSLFSLLSAGLEFAWLSRRLGFFLDGEFFKSLARCMLCSTASALAAQVILSGGFRSAPLIAAVAAAAVYVGLAWLLGDEFAVKYGRLLEFPLESRL